MQFQATHTIDNRHPQPSYRLHKKHMPHDHMLNQKLQIEKPFFAEVSEALLVS